MVSVAAGPASPERVSLFARLQCCTIMGEAPEEIARDYGHLSLTQVHAALAYYYANEAEINADLEVEERVHNSLAEQHQR
jgi:hypothetical protein